MKTDKDNESELLARIAALESELRRLLDLVGAEDRESIERVLGDEMAERAETELERVKAELLALKVTEEHTFAAQRIAEADVEELRKELERVKKVCAEMREALETASLQLKYAVVMHNDHYSLANQACIKALAKAKEAGL